MSITLDQNAIPVQLLLEGAIDIASSAELKRVLIVALGSGSGLRVSLRDVTALDVTAIQLLWAALRFARASSIDMRLDGPLADGVSASLCATALAPFLKIDQPLEAGEVVLCQP